MEKRGLGKGLGALIAGSMAEDDTTNIREVPLDQIVANPFQPRQQFDPTRLAELAQSVQEHGILQPLLVRRKGVSNYELIAGERRFRAARQVGLRVVPVIIREMSDEKSLEVALIENIQREDINAVEAAQAYRRLIDEFGLTQQEIARRVGKSQSAVANTLRLLSLPAQILDSLNHGEITEGHARALLQAQTDHQITAWRMVVNRGLNVRDTERMVRESRANPRSPATPSHNAVSEVVETRDPNHAAVEEALQIALGTRVQIRKAGANYRIEIEFYSSDQLEGLVERLIGEAN